MKPSVQVSHVHCGLADMKQQSYVMRLHNGIDLWCSSLYQSFFSWFIFSEPEPEEEIYHHLMMV